MTTLNVQFSDGTHTAIITVFSAPQGPEYWPNCGTVESSDTIWKDYWEARDAFTQQFLTTPTDG